MRIRYNPKAPISKLHISGHKLNVTGGGYGQRDDFVSAHCECGQHFRLVFTIRQRDARRLHQRHLRQVIASKLTCGS